MEDSSPGEVTGAEESRPGYYAIIPADVRYDKRIPANAKLLYGEISALIGMDGFCYATNAYFARIYRCSEDSVGRWLALLEKEKYIVRDLERDSSGQIVKRKLYLTVSVPDGLPLCKIADTSPQNYREGICKNAGEINTSNTSIEKKKIKKEKERPEPLTDDQLREYWISWITQAAASDWTRTGKNDLFAALMAFYAPREKKRQDPTRTENACNRLGNLLLRDGQSSPTAMIQMLDRATACCWKSVYPPNNGKAAPQRAPVSGGDYDEY